MVLGSSRQRCWGGHATRRDPTPLDWAITALSHGLQIEHFVLARPTGVGRADDIDIRMPIEGAGDWLSGTFASA